MTDRPHCPHLSARRAASAVAALALTVSIAACGSSGQQNSAAAAVTHGPAAAASPSSAAPSARPVLHMVTNGSHRLAFYVIAGRKPAIVLDSGGGEDHTQWSMIAPELARSTGREVITYDRAGSGASDEVPGPWHVGAAVSDLHAGLAALGATHGVMLVAHSEAAEIATMYTRAHPGQVSRAVLIDPSVPQFYSDTEIARVEAATRPEIAALRGKPSTRQTRQLLAVAADYGPWHRAYHRLTWPSSVPVTVIASATTPFPTSPGDAQAWRAALTAFAHAGPDRRLVLAPHSSHEVPTDRPDVVVGQVTRAVAPRG